jgi:hypothetical protein
MDIRERLKKEMMVKWHKWNGPFLIVIVPRLLKHEQESLIQRSIIIILPTLTSSSNFIINEEDILEHVIVQNALDECKGNWCRTCNNNATIASCQYH